MLHIRNLISSQSARTPAESNLTTMFWIRVALLLTTALFAVEDLVGSANIARFEAACKAAIR